MRAPYNLPFAVQLEAAEPGHARSKHMAEPAVPQKQQEITLYLLELLDRFTQRLGKLAAGMLARASNARALIAAKATQAASAAGTGLAAGRRQGAAHQHASHGSAFRRSNVVRALLHVFGQARHNLILTSRCPAR